MESGIDAINTIKETRNRFLAIQKLSKEIFEETITKINELKSYHEQITADKISLEKNKSALPMLEMNNLLLDQRIIILETILNDKKQCVDKQEKLLKADQQNIFSARSSYCDRVYQYLNEGRTIHAPSKAGKNYLRELNDLERQMINFGNELRRLNENILEKESSRKDLQKQQKLQKDEESRYQRLLEDKKETLRNLMQQVKYLKFNHRKNEINHTIENLYHRNNRSNFPSTENVSEREVSNYFNNSTTDNTSKQSETLNKIKNLRAAKATETNSKSSVAENNQISISNQDHFNRSAIKRQKTGEESILPMNSFASDVLPSSSDGSSRINEIHNIAENNRRKFVPKKPIYSSKLM